MIIGMNLVVGMIYVMLPGAMVLFFRSPHVAATCQKRDTHPSWASQLPQRLLSLVVTFVLCGLSIIAVPSYSFVFPFFGTVLSGWTGAACWFVAFVLCFALAVGTVRREWWAWWTAMGGCLAAAVSSAATFARVEPDAVFEAMRLAPEQLLIVEHLWPHEPWIHVFVWLAIWGSLLAYLVVVKPLFGGQEPTSRCGFKMEGGAGPEGTK
jgi:hypothetical protein